MLKSKITSKNQVSTAENIIFKIYHYKNRKFYETVKSGDFYRVLKIHWTIAIVKK